MRYIILAPVGACLTLLATAALAQTENPLPVREVTVFKDGHAFINRQGQVRTTNGGAVLLNDLPNPVMGTFWPYSAQNGVILKSVTARLQSIPLERAAVSPLDYLRANIGNSVVIRRNGTPTQDAIRGTVVSVLPEPWLPDTTQPILNSQPTPYNPGFRPGNGGFLSEGFTVLIRTEEGLFPIPVAQISSISLPPNGKTRLTDTVQRNELALDLTGAPSGQPVEVGLMYLQRGIRWIPNYKVSLDGKGTAQVQFQATLINDLIDLDKSLINLVVGVPTFLFQDNPDPIGLQDTFARLSRYFGPDSNTGRNLSNAIMGQGGGGFAGPGMGMGIGLDLSQQPPAPVVTDAERNEDLYLFPIRGITLKKGSRMTLPVVDFALKYEDIYTLELLPTPVSVPDVDNNPELARLFGQPKVQKQIRLKNSSSYPLTTAPALLLNGKSILAQGMMRYTPQNATSDLPLTVGVNVVARREDKETKRTRQAVRINNTDFTEVEVSGSISITNYDKTPIPLEVTRYVLGTVLNTSAGGKVAALDPVSELDNVIPQNTRGFYRNVPYNGIGRVTWRVTVAPGQTIRLTYDWKYLM